MNLTIVKKNETVDADNKVGVVLVGGSEIVDRGLGEQILEKSYWTKVDNQYDKGHIFEDVDLDNFYQTEGDGGITFLTAKSE